MRNRTSWKIYHFFFLNFNVLPSNQNEKLIEAPVCLCQSSLAPSQWETSFQSNAASHWLGANLESALPISQYRYSTGSWNPSLWKTGSHLSFRVNTMAANGWPGDLGSQVISSNVIDLVLLEHSMQNYWPLNFSKINFYSYFRWRIFLLTLNMREPS